MPSAVPSAVRSSAEARAAGVLCALVPSGVPIPYLRGGQLGCALCLCPDHAQNLPGVSSAQAIERWRGTWFRIMSCADPTPQLGARFTRARTHRACCVLRCARQLCTAAHCIVWNHSSSKHSAQGQARVEYSRIAAHTNTSCGLRAKISSRRLVETPPGCGGGPAGGAYSCARLVRVRE